MRSSCGLRSCLDHSRHVFAVFVFAFLPTGITRAQTIRVDTTPAHAILFDPNKTLGTSLDILSAVKEFPFGAPGDPKARLIRMVRRLGRRSMQRPRPTSHFLARQ